MPIDTTWDPEREIWTLAVDGEFTFTEVAGLLDKTDWHDATRFLWDLRDARRGPNATEEVRRIVDLIARQQNAWRGSRVAIAVERDFGFAIARMFQSYADGLGIAFEVFRDVDTAIAWMTARREPAPD